MSGRKVEVLTRLLSGRAKALGFKLTLAGDAIMARIRRGACLGCSVTVWAGAPFPPPQCGCGQPQKRAAAAAGKRGYIGHRLRDGWCLPHAETLPKGTRRPGDCRECQNGLPDWSGLLVEARAGDFFARHPLGHPVPAIPRHSAEGGEVVEALPEREPEGPERPRGRALLDGAGLSDPVGLDLGGRPLSQVTPAPLTERERRAIAEARARARVLMRAIYGRRGL